MRSVMTLVLCGMLATAWSQSHSSGRSPWGIGTATDPPSLQRLSPPTATTCERMGLFCKLDVQLERRLRFPLVIRLGDPLQVDAWEGKGALRRMRP